MSANLGFELAMLGERTLLIDLDTQCDLSRLYGIESRHPTLYDVLAEAVAILRPNLCAVPGSEMLAYLDYRYREDLLLKILAENTDIVLIDTPLV